jgi:hypothetical protein
MSTRRVAWAVVVVLLVLAGAIVWWEPWHGPIVVSLSSGHGIDTGDLLVVPLAAVALVLWRSTALRSSARGSRRQAISRWAAPACAGVLGALLFVVGILDLSFGGPLLPAAGGTFDGQVLYTGAGSSLRVNEWIELAETFDGTRLRLYENGRQVASRSVPGPLDTTPLPLWIGGNSPYGEYFNGVIDDVRIYARALTPAEIDRDATTPTTDAVPADADRSGPVAAYSFDAGEGTVADDISGHGNSGRLLGATWTADGRYGSGLKFDGLGAVVRVEPSSSLDMTTAMTISAWVKPATEQSGWRTVVQREVDGYFLVASSARLDRLGRWDDVIAGVIVVVALMLGLQTYRSGGAWLGARRRWPVGVAVAGAGLLIDVLLAPSGAVVGPALLAGWLAATARDRVEAVALWVLAAVCLFITWASLARVELLGLRLSADDGGPARAAALGMLLFVSSLLGLRRAARTDWARD